MIRLYWIILLLMMAVAAHGQMDSTVINLKNVVVTGKAGTKSVTGHSVTSYIDRHTVPILKEYLNDERLSLTQIAELMNFASLSYFSRYCTKHLGQSPSEYRQSLQPK